LLVAAGRWVEGSFTDKGVDMPTEWLKHGDVALTIFYDPPRLERDPDLVIHPGVFFGKTGMPTSVAGDSPSTFLWRARQRVEEVIDAFAALF
jgi:hypothetical protein